MGGRKGLRNGRAHGVHRSVKAIGEDVRDLKQVVGKRGEAEDAVMIIEYGEGDDDAEEFGNG